MERVLKSGRGKSSILFRFLEEYVLQDKKWILLVRLFLLQIFDSSKIRKHSFENGRGRSYILLIFTKRYVLEDRKWLFISLFVFIANT